MEMEMIKGAIRKLLKSCDYEVFPDVFRQINDVYRNIDDPAQAASMLLDKLGRAMVMIDEEYGRREKAGDDLPVDELIAHISLKQGIISFLENPCIEKYATDFHRDIFGVRNKVVEKVSENHGESFREKVSENHVESFRENRCPERSETEDQEIADLIKRYKPNAIKAFLDNYVVGQEKTKEVLSQFVYLHMLKQIIPVENFPTSALLIGPTGSGKTYIVQMLKKIYPYIAFIDGSVLTTEGFKGENSREAIRAVLRKPGGDKSIIFIDEVDSMVAAKFDAGGANVSNDIQSTFLTLLQGEGVGGISTKKCSFIFAGAFASTFRSYHGYSQSEVKEKVISAGMLPEFAGRIGTVLMQQQLTQQDYLDALKGSVENGPLSQLRSLLAYDGQKIQVDEKALVMIAKHACQSKRGMREATSILLSSVMEKSYSAFERGKDNAILLVTEKQVEKMMGGIYLDVSRYLKKKSAIAIEGDLEKAIRRHAIYSTSFTSELVQIYYQHLLSVVGEVKDKDDRCTMIVAPYKQNKTIWEELQRESPVPIVYIDSSVLVGSGFRGNTLEGELLYASKSQNLSAAIIIIDGLFQNRESESRNQLQADILHFIKDRSFHNKDGNVICLEKAGIILSGNISIKDSTGDPIGFNVTRWNGSDADDRRQHYLNALRDNGVSAALMDHVSKIIVSGNKDTEKVEVIENISRTR